MKTWHEKRAFDSWKCLTFIFIGAIAFGVWQHSYFAGLFGFIILDALFTIGWTIEYGAHLPHNLGEPTKVEYTSETKRREVGTTPKAYGRWDSRN